MPRRKGSLNINTSQMLRAIAQAPGETIILRLAHVMDNERFPLQLRLDALKWLSADQFGKLKLSQSVKEKVNQVLDDEEDDYDSFDPNKEHEGIQGIDY